VRWTFHLPSGQVRQSPVVIDGVLVIGDCRGDLRAYDISDTAKQPTPLWTVSLGGCIESTPAVWKGRMYFGTRAGAIHAIG
jgi:outer membrane protein assembly factor BamB